MSHPQVRWYMVGTCPNATLAHAHSEDYHLFFIVRNECATAFLVLRELSLVSVTTGAQVGPRHCAASS